MTQYWDINDQGGLDIWDHNGTQLAENAEWSGTWSGDYPEEPMHEIVKQHRNRNQPTIYNQNLDADYLYGDVERGNPNLP